MLTLAGLVFGLVTTLPGFRFEPGQDPNPVPAGYLVAYALVAYAFFAVLLVRIIQGRNWARWTLIIIQAITWALALTDPGTLAAQRGIATATDVLIIALEVWATVLVLRSPRAHWTTAN